MSRWSVSRGLGGARTDLCGMLNLGAVCKEKEWQGVVFHNVVEKWCKNLVFLNSLSV